MNKTIIKYGLISGLIMAGLMWATIPFMDRIGFDYGMYFGYTGMVVAFLLVFFGVRAYRETEGGGYISFLRGLAVGLMITFISCVLYVASWEVLYHAFLPDFIDKYANHMVSKMKAEGKPQTDIDVAAKQMDDFKKLYANPFIQVAFTFIEPLPVGILVSIISALVLRKRRPLDIPDPPMPTAYA